MTIEQKAKSYYEAIERAKGIIEQNPLMEYLKKGIEYIFPELKESEDERIRKELIEHVKDQQSSFISAPDCRDKYEEEENNKYNAWIAWLEKQGEQKPTLPKWKYKKDNTPLLRDSIILNKYGCVAKSPSGAIVSDVWVIDYAELAKLPKEEFEKQAEQKPTLRERYKNIAESEWFKKTHEGMSISDEEVNNVNKVEPKFKVGDWIISKYMHLVMQILNNDNGSYKTVETDGTERNDSYNFIERNFKRWTIQDTKDGDVLAFDNETIVIFKDLYNTTTFHSYCHVEKGVFSVSKDDMPDWWAGKWFHPATKEQHDTLFAKMKEAGYEWDADKKELKKIEQQFVNNEYTFKSIPRLLEMIEPTNRAKAYCQKLIDSLQKEGYSIDAKIVGDCLKQMNGEKVAMAVMDNVMNKQKPAWSEEDEKIALSIEQVINCASLLNIVPEKMNKIKTWLKSLKDRVRPNQEWSEKDEKMCQETIDWFEKKCFPYALEDENPAKESISWLKSLKDRYTWKQDEKLSQS